MARLTRLASLAKSKKKSEQCASKAIMKSKAVSKNTTVSSYKSSVVGCKLQESASVLSDDLDWDKVLELVDLNIDNALCENTKKQYTYWFKRFETFCKTFGRKMFPFNDLTCVAFLSHLAESSDGLGGIDQARAALRHWHCVRYPHVASPTESVRVNNVVRGIKRRFKKHVVKKKPLLPKEFEKLLLVATQDGKLSSLKLVDLRFAAQLSLMYCTFSRYEESSMLKIGDVFKEEELWIANFPKGKQYQYGEAREGVLVSQPKMRVNPTEVVRFYKEKIQSIAAEDSFLFPSLRCRGKKVVVLDHAASYDCVLKQFKFFAKKAGVSGKPQEYGLHSIRRGGVTAAANNGCDDHTLRKQMRVASTETVARYATLSRDGLSLANLALFKDL